MNGIRALTDEGEEQTESLERDVVPLVEISWKGSIVSGSSGLGLLQQSTFYPHSIPFCEDETL
jgi:hypothetical protein